MKVTPNTKRTLEYRRAAKRLRAQGYEEVFDPLGIGQRDRWHESVQAVACIPGHNTVFIKMDGGKAYQEQMRADTDYFYSLPAYRHLKPTSPSSEA